MIDADFAEIYEYTTKRFNQQVKNTIEKFDTDFRVQLTQEELEILRSKKLTSSWGGTRYSIPQASERAGTASGNNILRAAAERLEGELGEYRQY